MSLTFRIGLGLMVGSMQMACMSDPEPKVLTTPNEKPRDVSADDWNMPPPQPDDTIGIIPDSATLSSLEPKDYVPASGGLAKAASTPYIILYTDKDYGGSQFVIHSPRDWSNLATTPAGNWNDKVSSIRFFNGAEAAFWVARDFSGGGYAFGADIPNLVAYSFNDVISSVSWALPDPNNAYILAWPDINWRGTPVTLYYPLDYNQLPPGINNKITSMLIDNESWRSPWSNVEPILYYNENWGGIGRVFSTPSGTTSYYNPVPSPDNDQYSSLIWE